jgi:8-oxo-dGTP pyrophosphatase MutT (NUDIX family)
MTAIARVRATSYITRQTSHGQQLLVFNYPSAPKEGTHLPGGGVEPGERPDAAAIREAIEETGIQGHLELQGVVGVQQTTYDTGAPCISVYFHLITDETRDAWTHTMVGDPDAWDTGLEIQCRFLPLAEAAEHLRTSWHQQEAFVGLLLAADSHRSPITAPSA